jgi:hypothetical protein
MDATFYISDKERAALPADSFAGPGRSFPIRNQQDVHDAARLIAHADDPAAVRAAIIRIAKRKGFKLPASWQVGMAEEEETETEEAPALFRAIDAGSHRVYTDSLIFRAGDYPDKAYKMNAAEIAAAAAAYDPTQPARVNLEHAPAMLTGKLGEVRSLYVDPTDPTVLRGAVAVPKWLDDQLTEGERRVSAEFDRATKTLTGLALTPTPRVQGAALMAAFNAATTETGGIPATTAPARGKETHPMPDLWGEFKALFKKAGIEVEEAPATEPAGVAISGAEFSAMKAELTALKAQIAGSATFSDAKIKSEAEAFGRVLFTANKVLPAQVPAIVAGYVAALQADRTAAQFSADGKMATPTLDTFTACFTGLPAHQLTEERIADVAENREDAIFALGQRPDAEAVKMAKAKQVADRLNAGKIYAKRAAIGTGKAM